MPMRKSMMLFLAALVGAVIVMTLVIVGKYDGAAWAGLLTFFLCCGIPLTED
jgi:hypothetical protein